nr:hypothetical protein [Candidatus Njordarchaeum guaymaensis]
MACLEEFFMAEFARLRDFYSIQLNQDDIKEIIEWLKDRLELGSESKILDTLKVISPLELQQLRYDLVQFIKRIRKNRTGQARTKLPPLGAEQPLDEREERDRRLG